ncbi:cyanase [Streptomyces sp. NPDC021020]|uniref:cyanase n=1 Tax=Streptomyces sp. NPDC021020 TaxID=3365109 RepID=UPI0037AE0C41
MSDAGKDGVPGGLPPRMDRDDITAAIVAARLAKGLTWQKLADEIGRPVVWSTAALLGQHPLPPDAAHRVVRLLDLPEEAVPVLAAVPHRGAGGVPTDPTIYRLHEAVQVYGPALKELIHEQFGDGIMSAINFKVDIGTATHDGAAHVVITFDGKFLPYNWPSD